MADYHVGCGNFGIYAGLLNKSGDRWKEKSCVTDEVVSAAAQYLLQEKKIFSFTYNRDGCEYEMRVTKVGAT